MPCGHGQLLLKISLISSHTNFLVAPFHAFRFLESFFRLSALQIFHMGTLQRAINKSSVGMQLSKPSLLQQQVRDGKPPERIAFGNHHTVHRLSVWRKGQLDFKLWEVMFQATETMF